MCLLHFAAEAWNAATSHSFHSAQLATSVSQGPISREEAQRSQGVFYAGKLHKLLQAVLGIKVHFTHSVSGEAKQRCANTTSFRN